MRKSRFLNRKLNLQALDRRCVMDAEGLDVPVEVIMADDGDEVASSDMAQVTAKEMSVENLDSVMINFSSAANSPPARNFDVNGNGRVTPLDALLIINAISRQQRGASATAFARASMASNIENGSSLDVNRDARVTPMDALMVINEMSRDRSASLLANSRMAIAPDSSPAAEDEPLTKPFVIPEEAPIEPVKSLGLADVETYGVVFLEIDSEGVIKAEADGQVVEISVGKDGALMIGELVLPAYIVPSATGEPGIVSGYPPFSGEIPPDDLLPVDFAIGESTRVAGASILTVTGIGDLPLVISVSSNGEITAFAGAETLEVTITDDGVLSIGGQRLPISILKFDDTTLLVPMASESEDVIVSWPMAVDEVMAEFA